MNILFDQATPVPIRNYLKHHSIRTASEQGWEQLKNGDLLTEAEEAGFDLLLTTDKNMAYQQNFSNRRIAIIVLGQQQWPWLRPHVQRVVEAVDAATPGSYAEVENSDSAIATAEHIQTLTIKVAAYGCERNEWPTRF